MKEKLECVIQKANKLGIQDNCLVSKVQLSQKMVAQNKQVLVTTKIFFLEDQWFLEIIENISQNWIFELNRRYGINFFM
jgi:hypothetical protein